MPDRGGSGRRVRAGIAGEIAPHRVAFSCLLRSGNADCAAMQCALGVGGMGGKRGRSPVLLPSPNGEHRGRNSRADRERSRGDGVPGMAECRGEPGVPSVCLLAASVRVRQGGADPVGTPRRTPWSARDAPVPLVGRRRRCRPGDRPRTWASAAHDWGICFQVVPRIRMASSRLLYVKRNAGRAARIPTVRT